MKRISSVVFLSVPLALLPSCDKDNPDKPADTGYRHGVFITNEGGFGNSNGSVSYFDPDSIKMVNHIFELINGRSLGDVVQSMSVHGNKGFIVVNNSQKLEVVDLNTFESLGIIDGLSYPRFFLPVSDNKGYLSDGNFSGTIYVVDTDLLQITDSLQCGFGPEHLLRYGNLVLVANSGGWGNDSTITVIDSRSDEVAWTWQTGYNPTDMVLDGKDNLWVLCKGKIVWEGWTLAEETGSSIEVIDVQTGSTIRSIPVGMTGDYFWPMSLGVSSDGSTIYYLESGGVYQMDCNASTALDVPLIQGIFYGFGIDPETDLIYGLSAPTFTANGWLLRYDPAGSLIDSIEVGIGPNRVVFN